MKPSFHSAALPLVLVGETRSRANIETLKRLRWGRMFVVQPPTPYHCEPWGFDNGAFVAWRNGLPFPEDNFLRRLDVAQNVAMDPILAVTPDIVAAGNRSLDFSTAWRMSHKLPSAWPWYLAVQDGMTEESVRPHLHLYSGLFLGGTDRFKETAFRWRQLAHGHRLKFHYGRAGTPRKLLSAFKVGADSCDSSFPLWTAQRMIEFERIHSGLGCQLTMSEAGY